MRLTLLILLLFPCVVLHAQVGLTSPDLLRGTVVDATGGQPLAAVTVINTVTQQSAFTDEDGSFTIRCRPDQRIVFSYVGYKSTELKAPAGGSYVTQRIALQRLSYQMSEYIVRPKYTPYQADSIGRHSTYQRALARQKAGSLGSPVTLLAEKLSKRSRQIFRFQKEFNYWEGQRFVDTRYSPEVVEQMTHLTGDTLAHFMNEYPMPYDYARAASELEVKMWIRTNYREWLLKQSARGSDTVRAADTSAMRH